MWLWLTERCGEVLCKEYRPRPKDDDDDDDDDKGREGPF